MKKSKGKVRNKKLIYSIVIVCILVVIGLTVLVKTIWQEKPIGGETDEHGCMLMAGYTWCESKQKCLRTWEEECPLTAEECAKEGEQFSLVYKDYPEQCCEGLKEWNSGFDTSISIADECYETGLLAGSPIGTCIKCGDGICGDIENPCNCPEDCKGKNKSNFSTVEEFCQSNDWKISFSNACEETTKDFPICNLC